MAEEGLQARSADLISGQSGAVFLIDENPCFEVVLRYKRKHLARNEIQLHQL